MISEGLYLALRVRFPPIEDSDLVMRVLVESPQRLVASPEFLKGIELPLMPADLVGLASLDWGPPRDHVWCLDGPDGVGAQVSHQPRYITDDMTALCQAALRSVGIVQLPHMVVDQDLPQGRLIDILPSWVPRSGFVHAVFPTCRSLIPSVRTLIDYLAEHIEL